MYPALPVRSSLKVKLIDKIILKAEAIFICGKRVKHRKIILL
jgi:hypothetical protein